jgi:hypothetical protein
VLMAAETRGADRATGLTPERLKQCEVLLRRTILTLGAVPATDSGSEIESQIRGAAELAVIERSERASRFRPSPRDLDTAGDVLAWLAWLWRQPNGERDVKILIARAHGAQWWRLGKRFDRSEQQLRRWEKAAIAAIAERFWRDVARLCAAGPYGRE